MSKFWIIALNVYKKQVRSAAFLIMVLAPLVIGALYYGMGKFMSDASSIDKIGVYDQQMVLTNALSQSKEFEFQAMKSEKAGEKQLAEDKIDAFLILDTSKEVLEAKLLAKDSVETSTQLKLRMMLSQIQRQISAQKLGLSAQQLAQLDQQVPLTVNKVTVNDQGQLTKKQEDGAAVQMIIGFACTIIYSCLLLIMPILSPKKLRRKKVVGLWKLYYRVPRQARIIMEKSWVSSWLV